MRASNVNQQLARAALNWNSGQEDKAIVNLEADINSIMLENRVTRAQAVDALTGALSADISHVMNSCGVSYALASAAMEWSLGGVEEAVLNLNADIEAITHGNSEGWQFASETISRAQAIRALEGALVAFSLCVSDCADSLPQNYRSAVFRNGFCHDVERRIIRGCFCCTPLDPCRQ